MRSLVMTWMIGLTALLLPISQRAEAQQAEDSDPPAEADRAVAREADISGYELAETLKDRVVVNALGEEIGDISNIIIRGDRVTHAIISIGGFIGLGGSDIVVPFDVLTFEGDQVTMDTIASSDQIEGLTPFEYGDFGLSE